MEPLTQVILHFFQHLISAGFIYNNDSICICHAYCSLIIMIGLHRRNNEKVLCFLLPSNPGEAQGKHSHGEICIENA